MPTRPIWRRERRILWLMLAQNSKESMHKFLPLSMFLIFVTTKNSKLGILLIWTYSKYFQLYFEYIQTRG